MSATEPNICPACKNRFLQPFVCTTCGAEKLYDATVRGQAAEILRQRELLARWMIERGFSTGHGDTTEDLLSELAWQVAELRRPSPALRELLIEAADEIETFLAHDTVDCQEPGCEMCAEDRRVADLARRLRGAAG